MKKIIFILTLIGLHIGLFAQEIFKTNLRGMSVQSFSSSNPIDRFTLSGPDAEGFMYLIAHAKTESGEILRTRWQGTGVQDFSLSQDQILTGFDVESDGEFVYLVALGSDGSSGQIIRTKWLGSAVQALPDSDGQGIKTITASGPDSEGYVYLSAFLTGIEEPGDEWLEPPKFTLTITGVVNANQTRISYSVARSCCINLSVYDATGRIVTNLINSNIEAGPHETIWLGTDKNGKKVSAGIYFVKMDAGEFTTTRKVIVVR